MKIINWEILKFKYEIFGISLEALAIDNSISLPVLKHNAENWKQFPLVKDEEDNLISNATDQAKLYATLKQQALSSKYVELEMLLLYKAIELTNGLETENSSSIIHLKNLTEILTNLLDKNPSLHPALSDKDDLLKPGGKWEINIIQGDQHKTDQTLNVEDAKSV